MFSLKIKRKAINLFQSENFINVISRKKSRNLNSFQMGLNSCRNPSLPEFLASIRLARTSGESRKTHATSSPPKFNKQ